jgi:hypothetical protein
MAAAFVQRYEQEIITAVSNEIDAVSKIEDRLSDPSGVIFGVDDFMTWTMGKPFLRGASDSRIQVGAVAYLGKNDRFVNIPVYVEFDTERVIAQLPR